MGDDTRQLKSYVWHRTTGRCFFVSTIERDSSAMTEPPPMRFMETIAWEYDWDSRMRGELVAMDGSNNVLIQHFEMCRQLYNTGEYKSQEECDERL